jgi:hypothetical protein
MPQLIRRNNVSGTTVGVCRNGLEEGFFRANVKLDDTVLHMKECRKAYTVCLGSVRFKMQAENHFFTQYTLFHSSTIKGIL